MSLFGGKDTKEEFGVIFDIGSGSVLVAIIYSDPFKPTPQIIWSHREHAPLKNIDSLEQSSKAVMTALVNASILFDTEGRKTLHEFNSSAQLKEVQFSISAPWSYTVTKTINYKQEAEFEITDDLLKQLYAAIEEKIATELKENEALQDLGLEIITKNTMASTANGYIVKEPEGNRAFSLSLSQGNAVTQQYLLDAVEELHSKLFAEAKVRKLSFILIYHALTRRLMPNKSDVCLIDVTYEATEMGIVREGVLSYCTHTPFGSFSLAREISAITQAPLHEAFSYLHNDKPYQFIESLPAKQKDEVEELFESYIQKVTELFKETGDSLAIPQNIVIHSDLKSEALFNDLIKKATKRAIKTEPDVTQISTKIIDKLYKSQTEKAKVNIPKDTALLLSAQFFHTERNHYTYKYL